MKNHIVELHHIQSAVVIDVVIFLQRGCGRCCDADSGEFLCKFLPVRMRMRMRVECVCVCVRVRECVCVCVLHTIHSAVSMLPFPPDVCLCVCARARACTHEHFAPVYAAGGVQVDVFKPTPSRNHHGVDFFKSAGYLISFRNLLAISGS